MYPSSETIAVDIDITNTSQLRLVVERVGDNNFCSHADWADAKLLLVANADVIPPTTPSNLNVSTIAPNNFQLSWTASTDNLSNPLHYEILVNGLVIGTVFGLQYTLPVQPANTYMVVVQAKDNANNRAVSTSLPLNYTPCGTTQNVIDDYNNATISLKTSQTINATNRISGTSKINYQAAKSIDFLPGFSVDAGSVFKAKIGGCND